MKKESYIYALYFPKLDLYKLGRTTNYKNRTLANIKVWGDIDKQKSAILNLNVCKEELQSIENIIKHIFYKYKHPNPPNLIGKTEIITLVEGTKFIDVYEKLLNDLNVLINIENKFEPLETKEPTIVNPPIKMRMESLGLNNTDYAKNRIIDIYELDTNGKIKPRTADAIRMMLNGIEFFLSKSYLNKTMEKLLNLVGVGIKDDLPILLTKRFFSKEEQDNLYNSIKKQLRGDHSTEIEKIINICDKRKGSQRFNALYRHLGFKMMRSTARNNPKDKSKVNPIKLIDEEWLNELRQHIEHVRCLNKTNQPL